MGNLPNLEASGAYTIADCLATIPGGRALDVGTGKGEFIETLMKALQSYDSFVGIDIADEDLDKARESFQNQPVEFLEMDAEHLDFADTSFDTVCIANSLHHLANIPQVLGEMKRVLKPGGSFIVEEPYQDGGQSEAQHTTIREHHWTAKIDRIQGIVHNETLSRPQIVKFLEDLTFTNLEVIDSTRPVQCVFCSEAIDCEDPKSESTVNAFLKGVDRTLQQLHPRERTRELVSEAEQLKVRAKLTGVQEASLLFIIGTK